MSPLRSLGNTLSSFKDFYSRTGTDAYKPPLNLIEGFDIMLVAGGGSGGGSVGGGGGGQFSPNNKGGAGGTGLLLIAYPT